MNKKNILSLILMVVGIAVFSQHLSAQEMKFVSVDDAAKTALNVGAKAPAFSLKDSTGKLVNSKDLLKQGSVVLVFYRGSWCPFCNAYLHKLQTRLPEFTAAGGKRLQVSVK